MNKNAAILAAAAAAVVGAVAVRRNRNKVDVDGLVTTIDLDNVADEEPTVRLIDSSVKEG